MERSLLRWQQTVQGNYLATLQRDYLLVAVPGAGKTFWAIHTAKHLLRNNRIERIAIVVPTTHVKGQWARTAHELGINIEFDYRNRDGAWPPDADGVVMTYSQMDAQPALHGYHVAQRPTLVILDEVHHLEDDASWGKHAQESFDMAAYRIHLSGTPWNANGQIPWVRYGPDGRVIPDFTYTYQESLEDRVNCDVFFPKIGAKVEWDWDGDRFIHNLGDNMSESDRARALRTVLSPFKSDYIRQTFVKADEELTSIRQGGQDRAGGMIITETTKHADAIADLIADKIHKPRPTVITSAEPGAAHALKSFTNSTDRWIVSVRMVSEGVDIPRLRVLLYATNYTTQLFFRQAVGRIIRGPEPPAVVFLPADPKLLTWASEIKKERIQALQQAQELADTDTAGKSRNLDPASQSFAPVSGETFDAGVIHAEMDVTQPEIDHVTELIRGVGAQPDLRTATTLAKVLRAQGAAPITVPTVAQTASPLQSERKEALRKIMGKMIASHCFQTGADHKLVNAQLNQALGVRSVRDCTEEQLRQRYELLKQLFTQ